MGAQPVRNILATSNWEVKKKILYFIIFSLMVHFTYYIRFPTLKMIPGLFPGFPLGASLVIRLTGEVFLPLRLGQVAREA